MDAKDIIILIRLVIENPDLLMPGREEEILKIFETELKYLEPSKSEEVIKNIKEGMSYDEVKKTYLKEEIIEAHTFIKADKPSSSSEAAYLKAIYEFLGV